MKLIPTYEHIAKRELLDCRYKSVKELVRHYNLNLNSYEVMLLSEGFTFNYDRIHIPGVLSQKIPYPTVSLHNVETTFFKNLKIDYKEEKIEDNDQGFEYMKSLIDKDMPILFKIDGRFLSESNEKKINGNKSKSGVERKLNLTYLSTILMAGYDDDDALVVLTNTDEKEVTSRMCKEDVQKYRNSKCLPFSPECICFYLNNEIKIDDTMLKKVILSSLKNIVDTMLSKEVFHPDMGGFVGTGMTRGILGMRNLKEDLKEILSQYDANNELSNKFIKLAITFIRNNMVFGSYSGFRHEFSKCLEVCANKYKVEDLRPVSEEFKEIGFMWRKLFMTLSSIIHSKGDFTEQFNQVIKILENIAQKEEEQYLKIKDVLA